MQNGIGVSFGILLPEASAIERSDLCSVFFNLMDNAIESCMHSDSAVRPEIALFAESGSGFLTIRMHNSKSPEIVRDSRTSKESADGHGFGLSIIEDICQKYGGFCHWQDNGDSFDSLIQLWYNPTAPIRPIN